jgi:hypothetical protein
MIYGHNGTIHNTQHLHVEVDKKGKVVAVWFRCCALPFEQVLADKARAAEMVRMSAEVNQQCKLNAVDIEEDGKHSKQF